MQKKRLYNSRVNLPALFSFILCAALYVLQFRAYYCGKAELSHVLLSMQFPFMHGIPYPQSDEQATPDISIAEDENIKIEVLHGGQIPMDTHEPRILIYHTHATEAYFKTKDCNYRDNGKWRTLESDKNMIAVGERLAEALRSRGIAVLHDTTNHEPPKLATAYSRSVVTMEKYRDKYPSITMFIDVHRDSYGSDPKEIADYVTIDGTECARIMFVVGTGKGATGTGYGEMPDFEANYALAEKITNALSQVNEDLVRDIRVKTGRYNQHISSQCLLVEVGHNANTLQQALNSMDYLAEAIVSCGDFDSGSLSLSP